MIISKAVARTSVENSVCTLLKTCGAYINIYIIYIMDENDPFSE